MRRLFVHPSRLCGAIAAALFALPPAAHALKVGDPLAAPAQEAPAQPAIPPASMERFGSSRALAAPIPRALRDVSPCFRTAREGERFGYRFHLPRGEYALELFFTELVWRGPANRVFSVFVNGEERLAGVDLVARDARSPGYLHEVLSATSFASGLEVRFEGTTREAVVSRIKITGNGHAVDVDCGGEGDVPTWRTTEPLGEALVATFGARHFVDLRPQWREFASTPLGKFQDEPKHAVIGFRTAAGTWALPLFRDRDDVQAFAEARETRTLSAVRYDVAFPGHRGSITLRAAFDPADRRLWSLPVIELEYTLARDDGGALAVGEAAPAAVFEMPIDGDAITREAAGRGEVRGVIARRRHAAQDATVEIGLFAPAGPGDPAAAISATRAFVEAACPLVAGADGVATARIYQAGYVNDALLEVDGAKYRTFYADRVGSIEAAVRLFLRGRERIGAAAAFADGLLGDALLPPSIATLAAHALPSFLLNTWYAAGTGDREGDVWYSCMEGYCRFHSTIDVEFNAAPFYFWFAPDLLRHLLDTWPRYERDGGFLAHDMGIDFAVDGPAYPHDMPVEENANYVLLLFEYWTQTGDEAFVRGKAALVDRLLAYVERADTDGDGFAEEGVANTIDDAGPAVQFARDQTYLGVKCAAAFTAGAEIVKIAGRGDRARAFRERARQIRDTLDAKGWLGDHYAVCLDADATGLIDPWAQGVTGRPVDDVAAESGERGQDGTGAAPAPVPAPAQPTRVDGWDAAHPYTAIGLLPLLRSGIAPPFDLERLRTDLRTAEERTRTRYGSAHAEGEVNVWVSLNLFRDAVACYLGDDVLDRSDRYLALQHDRAREVDIRDWAGFCDSPYNRYLSYYPRGTAVLALVDAAAGVALDRRKGTLVLRPVRAPLDVPIMAGVDWKALRVPRLVVTAGADGEPPRGEVTDAELLADLEVTIDLSRVGGEKWRLPKK